MYLNQRAERMKVNRWILLQISNHNNEFKSLETITKMAMMT